MTTEERIEEWANREAAKIPPLTREQAVGLLAIFLPGIEARRREKAA